MEKSGTIQCAGKKECHPTGIYVNRRKVLKLAAIATGAALSPSFLASLGQSTVAEESVQPGRHVKMKGTAAGKILTSRDDGKTWEVVADFGADCPVLGIRTVSSGLKADIGHKGYIFTLHSADGLQWSA